MTRPSILVVPSPEGNVSAAYEATSRLAQAMSARITVLEVQPGRGRPRNDEIAARVRTGANGLRACVERQPLARDDDSVADRRLLVRFGDRIDGIHREAHAGAHSLVVVQMDPGCSVKNVLALIRACPTSVWLVRTTNGERQRRGVIAVVDPSPEPVGQLGAFELRDPNAAARDRAVLSAADLLAGALAEPLTVFHAWRAVGETLLNHGRGRLLVSAVDVRRYVTEVGTAHAKAVAALVSSHGFRTAQPDVRIVKGDPTLAPVHHAIKVQASVLVAPASATSVVRDAVREAGCSVWVQR